MESFTVAEFGRRTSRVTYAAERAPVEITNRGDRVGVVLSTEAWGSLGRLFLALAGHGSRKRYLWQTADDETLRVLLQIAVAHLKLNGDAMQGPGESPDSTEPRCAGCRWWRRFNAAPGNAHSCRNEASDNFRVWTDAGDSCDEFEAKR